MPKRTALYKPWKIDKLKDRMNAAHYLMACAVESDESFLGALRDINEAWSEGRKRATEDVK